MVSKNILAIGILMLVLVGAVTSQDRNTPAPASVSDLVNEVRLLREAVERWHAGDSYRDVLLERYRNQHTATVAVADRLDAANADLMESEVDRSEQERQIKGLEETLRAVIDPSERTSREIELREARAALERIAARQSRLTQQVNRLTGDSDIEKGKLTTLEQRLEQLAPR